MLLSPKNLLLGGQLGLPEGQVLQGWGVLTTVAPLGIGTTHWEMDRARDVTHREEFGVEEGVLKDGQGTPGDKGHLREAHSSQTR